MRSKFDAASAKIVDLTNINDQRALLDKLLTMLHKKYPEFGAGKEAHEDLETYFRKNGKITKNEFIKVITDKNHDVLGFTVGSIIPSTKTATLTYMAVVNDKDIQARLIEATNDILARKKVSAVFVELYADGAAGSKKLEERNQNDKKLYGNQGLENVPVNYVQPLSPDPQEDTVVKQLKLKVGFIDKGLKPAEKATIIINHLMAFVQVYDPELEVPENAAKLHEYSHDLGQALWAPKPKPAGKPNLRLV